MHTIHRRQQCGMMVLCQSALTTSPSTLQALQEVTKIGMYLTLYLVFQQGSSANSFQTFLWSQSSQSNIWHIMIITFCNLSDGTLLLRLINDECLLQMKQGCINTYCKVLLVDLLGNSTQQRLESSVAALQCCSGYVLSRSDGCLDLYQKGFAE